MQSLGKWLCAIALCIVAAEHLAQCESRRATRWRVVPTMGAEKRRESIATLRKEGGTDVATSLRLGRLYVEESDARAAKEIYRRLLAKHPKHPRRDEMLYFMGVASDDPIHFRKLLAKYPKSSFAPDAMLQLADRLLMAGKAAEARKLYERVISSGKAPFVAYANYKRGSCLFQEGELDDAAGAMKTALVLPPGPVDIRVEAVHDLALVYAQGEDITEALAYFSSYPAETQRAALETIAAAILDDERYVDAIRIEEKLLSLDTVYQGNSRYEMAIARALELRGHRVEAAERIFDRLTYYVKGSRWYSANETVPRATREAMAAFEENGRKYAMALDTRKHYELYLNAFPATPYTAELRSRYAALLFRDGEPKSAAEQFYTAYRELTGRPAAQEALRNALAAQGFALNRVRAERGLPAIDRQSRERLKDDGDSTALDEIERRFVEVGSELLKKISARDGNARRAL